MIPRSIHETHAWRVGMGVEKYRKHNIQSDGNPLRFPMKPIREGKFHSKCWLHFSARRQTQTIGGEIRYILQKRNPLCLGSRAQGLYSCVLCISQMQMQQISADTHHRFQVLFYRFSTFSTFIEYALERPVVNSIEFGVAKPSVLSSTSQVFHT